jgi:hypothetical protein
MLRRQLRLEYEVAIYRLMARGDRGSPFIGNDWDRLALASAGECGILETVWEEQQAIGTLVSVPASFPKRRLSPCSVD